MTDLTDLGNVGAIKNPLVIKSIESKLPDFVKKDWLVLMLEPSNGVMPDNHFNALLKFLKKQEDMFERLEQLKTTDVVTDKPKASDRIEKRYNERYASTRATKKGVLRRSLLLNDWVHSESVLDVTKAQMAVKTPTCAKTKTARKEAPLTIISFSARGENARKTMVRECREPADSKRN